MTREEAIKELQESLDTLREYDIAHSSRLKQALEMAIKALSQEPCDVSVSEKEPNEITEEVTLRFFKNSLKVRWHDFVIYNVEWLKKNWQMEMDIVCGVKLCDDAVSRQAVLDRIRESIETYHNQYTTDMLNMWGLFTQFIKEMPSVRPQEPTDAISRDFEIGDEVRIIGSDPIYDDCDVGWVIRNASEKVKTMYVMRNDGSAEEEAKVEWYKTGRHNVMLAEVIKALPSVTQKGDVKNV